MLKFITGVSKYIIYTFQFVIVILGALMILFGLLPIVHGGYDSLYSKLAVGLGVTVFIIAFLGCFGAIRENRTMLTAHAVILLILFIVQIALAITVAIAIGNGYFDDMTSKLDKVFTDDHKLFNKLQLWLDCCGVSNYTDYVKNNQPFPGSCCGESDDFDASGERSCEIGYVFHTGCADNLTNYFEDNFRWISGIAIGFAVFEILASLFTFWTSRHLTKK
ncbi:hypothetical protein WA026_012055 [Henosepilachna vigintioctopunctata]|uniref:Tetraspanin n=1 Tax=Henosepilachna vigintioctopunctata TaxID=420089 RepID=A0AAW1VET1_9CUCU